VSPAIATAIHCPTGEKEITLLAALVYAVDESSRVGLDNLTHG
jgi:hypothetical protein